MRKATRLAERLAAGKRAFTLLELLVVVTIIVLLVAILMPAIGEARYKAKVLKCKMVLRGIAVAMTTYTQDYAGYYPTAARPNTDLIDWSAGADWPRSWQWLKNTPTTRDLRDSYREYLGGTLDRTMKCPLATRFFAEGDLDNHTGPDNPDKVQLSNYMLYVTNNANQKIFRFSTSDPNVVSSRVNTLWSPHNPVGLKFGYLASDVAFGNLNYGGTNYFSAGTVAGHPSPQGDYGEGGGPINSHPGHRLGIPPLFYPPDPTLAPAPINFVDGDGSVHTFNVTNRSINDSATWAINSNKNDRYLMPKALAK
ncbi:MAG: prepilin-type N-terminal cleavage/methylation domain-containing protein [Phycisphaera sp.]|nr:prepilin-type N-terminal cleavage/methylation domain-containing protein [Phycisphaera sp.]